MTRHSQLFVISEVQLISNPVKLRTKAVQIPEDPIISLALVDQARAYRVMGDVTKSRTAYQDFFALWKNADPDIPILKQAKAEYAKLQ
jgi:hypothetical protein